MNSVWLGVRWLGVEVLGGPFMGFLRWPGPHDALPLWALRRNARPGGQRARPDVHGLLVDRSGRGFSVHRASSLFLISPSGLLTESQDQHDGDDDRRDEQCIHRLLLRATHQISSSMGRPAKP